MIKKLVFPLILGVTIAIILIYLPPKNVYFIFGFIFLLTLNTYLVISLIINKKIGFIFSLFIGLFLIINYLVGFEVLNVIILISLLIALILLLK